MAVALGERHVVSLQVHNLSPGRGEGSLSTSGFMLPDGCGHDLCDLAGSEEVNKDGRGESTPGGA